MLWTCKWTRLLWYTCHYGRLILYIMQHWIKLQMDLIARSQIHSEIHSWLQSIVHSQPAWLTLPIKLSRRSQVHSRACSQGCSQLHSMAPSQPAWLYTPKYAFKMISSILSSTLSSTLPNALDDTRSLVDYTFPSTVSRCSNVHSEYAPKYTPNCTR